MFIAIFHSFLLFLQLLISDSSKNYNKKLNEIEISLVRNDFRLAKKLLRELNSKTLFNNNHIYDQMNLIDLKSQLSNFQYKPRENKILFALMLFESENKFHSLDYLKHEIFISQSDSLVKWFEIIANQEQDFSKLKNRNLNKERNKVNKNEALDLLNLMKNKEKYIQYE